LRTVGVDTSHLAEWRSFSRSARADLSAIGVTDLSDALDHSTGALYWDTVHTNEHGARVVAEALFGHLQPTLRRLLRSHR